MQLRGHYHYEATGGMNTSRIATGDVLSIDIIKIAAGTGLQVFWEQK